MKIKNRIILYFIVGIVVIVISSIILNIFFQQNYADVKYNKAYKYYEENAVSLDEYAKYLMDNGFIVTKEEIKGYETGTNQTCHIEENEVVIYDGNVPLLYATINENIINDFGKMLNITIFTILLTVVILMIIIYIIINKYIINRIVSLEKNVENYSKIKDLNFISYKNISDEITSLENKVSEMLKNIGENETNKQNLIMLISHEFKNPIANIDALINMHKNQVDKYKEANYVTEKISNENKKLEKRLNDLLYFYKNDSYFAQEKQVVKMSNLIKEIFVGEELINVEIIEKDSIEPNINVEKLKIILNNIKSNLIKYTKENTNILITINKDEIIFENEINYEKENSSKVGNIINDYLANELNIKIENEIKEEKYITKLYGFSK